MGYWGTSLNGTSLQIIGDMNPDGSEMLWGDAPADRLDDGIRKLIVRLRGELGRYPSVTEVDEVKTTAPEMLAAIEEAKRVFAKDIERPATDGEIAAGLEFSDTGTSLDSAMRADISVGDTIRWAVWADRGFGREIASIAEGTVAKIATREAKSFDGLPYRQPYYEAIDRTGVAHSVDKHWANKVLPGDKSIDEENEKRAASGR